MKPMIFNQEMVKAILEGRKTQTRRPVKYSDGRNPAFYNRDNFYKLVNGLNNKSGLWAGFYKDSDIFTIDGEQHIDAIYWKAPCQVGDVLYIRETWKKFKKRVGSGKSCGIGEFYGYKTEEDNPNNPSEFYEGKWSPSIHMPKEAARIFLKVTEVRVERVQDISGYGAEAEGLRIANNPLFYQCTDAFNSIARKEFSELWNSIYNDWDSNPFVWVISFERCERNG